MLGWLTRGLGGGRVTTRYPGAPEVPPPGWQGPVAVAGDAGGDGATADLCPTGAIAFEDGRYAVDRRRCIACGACVRADPQRFSFTERYETAELAPLRRALGDRVGALRRSVHIRHVDAGSDGSEEWEIAALLNPYYDVQRLGLFFTASPRHADVLLVTGGVTAPMRRPLERAYAAMPEPRTVVAVGTDACSGGLAAELGQVCGGVDRVLPVDVYVPGSPPSPIAILHGLLLAAGALEEGTA